MYQELGEESTNSHDRAKNQAKCRDLDPIKGVVPTKRLERGISGLADFGKQE